MITQLNIKSLPFLFLPKTITLPVLNSEMRKCLLTKFIILTIIKISNNIQNIIKTKIISPTFFSFLNKLKLKQFSLKRGYKPYINIYASMNNNP